MGLLYSKDGLKNYIGYFDADWAGYTDVRKSRSGYLFQMSGADINCRSKKQTCMALLAGGAEHMALA